MISFFLFFSTSLLPSQPPLQPFAVESPTSSSRRPWVPDLQPPLLRSFTLHRPLPLASPLQNIVPIMILKLPQRSSCADLQNRESLNAVGDRTPPRATQSFCTVDHAPPGSATRLHVPLRTCKRKFSPADVSLR